MSASPRRAGAERPRAWPAAVTAAVLGAAAFGAVHHFRGTADLEAGRERLLAFDLEAAEVLFKRQERAVLLGARARAGLAVARAIRGEAHAAPDALTLRWLGAEALLQWSLTHGPIRGTAALATAVRAAGDPLGALYLAALRLDESDDGAAQALVAQAPLAFAGRGLGREVTRTLDLRRTGARTLVRDAQGRLLGRLDAAGFRLAEDVDPALVPDALLRVLPAEGPAGVRSSLDLDLAQLALAALGAHRGSVVLLDPRTGAVRAAVSDAQTAALGGTPSFEERREPASIAKLVTTAAALRAGIDVDAVVSSLVCTGSYRVGRAIVWCASPAGPLRSVEHAMAVSCNMAFAVLAERVGRAALLDEFRRWGFDGNEGPFPGSAGRVVVSEGDARQLADLGIGLEALDITPLHAARLGLLAATGRNVQPSLYDATSGPLGLRPQGLSLPAPEAVLDPASAAFLESTMRGVAVYGTAAGVAPLDYPVAMKTGTAATWRQGYHVNYVGVAPATDPEVAFCVRVTHAANSPRASRAGREVLATLLQGLAERSRYAHRATAHRSAPVLAAR